MKLLENDNLILNAIEPQDIDFLCHIENDTENWKVSNNIAPFSKYLLMKYIENAALDIYTSKELRLIIRDKNLNTKIGIVDIFDFDFFHKRAGIGIIIDKKYRQKQYGEQTVQIIIDYCFNYLQLHSLFCNIAEDNLPSITLFKKLGFIVNGQKKDWTYYNKNYITELFLQLINNQ